MRLPRSSEQRAKICFRGCTKLKALEQPACIAIVCVVFGRFEWKKSAEFVLPILSHLSWEPFKSYYFLHFWIHGTYFHATKYANKFNQKCFIKILHLIQNIFAEVFNQLEHEVGIQPMRHLRVKQRVFTYSPNVRQKQINNNKPYVLSSFRRTAATTVQLNNDTALRQTQQNSSAIKTSSIEQAAKLRPNYSIIISIISSQIQYVRLRHSFSSAARLNLRHSTIRLIYYLWLSTFNFDFRRWTAQRRETEQPYNLMFIMRN